MDLAGDGGPVEVSCQSFRYSVNSSSSSTGRVKEYCHHHNKEPITLVFICLPDDVLPLEPPDCLLSGDRAHTCFSCAFENCLSTHYNMSAQHRGHSQCTYENSPPAA